VTEGKLEFAVLGLGRIGKIHSGNLATRVSGAKLVAVADVAPAELKAAAERLGGPRTFADHHEVLALKEVDAVAICSPTDLHYQMILDAAAAGKHIFCEKPIDLNVERVARVVEEVDRRCVQLMVGFQRRFDPTFQTMREAVEAGKIGQPHLLRISSRDPGPPPESYVLVRRHFPRYDDSRFRHCTLPDGQRCGGSACSGRSAGGPHVRTRGRLGHGGGEPAICQWRDGRD
jgi:myo-inositol 2-dehydrogenase/D-chiro-inositol 1-dehydrogenase